MRARQLRAACTQCTQHGGLLDALILRAGDGGIEHHQPRQQGKQEHELHGLRHLRHHFLHLCHNLRHVDDQQIGKLFDQRVEQFGIARRQVKTGDITHRLAFEQRWRRDHEKIDVEAVPIHFAQAGYRSADRRTRNVECQPVTQFYAQPLRNAVFHGILFARRATDIPPLSGRNAIVLGQVRRPRQIEFALDLALGALVGVIGGGDAVLVHLDQPSAYHRMHQRLGYFALREKCLQRRHLIVLYIHQKSVRRIRRQARLPGVNQVVAYQRQRQQRHQPQPQCNDLHNSAQRPPAQIGDAKAPTDAAVTQPRHRFEQQPRSRARDQHRTAESQYDIGAQTQITGFPEDHAGDNRVAQHIARDAAPAGRAQITAQHAHGRHAAQRQNGRHGKAQQQRDAGY